MTDDRYKCSIGSRSAFVCHHFVPYWDWQLCYHFSVKFFLTCSIHWILLWTMRRWLTGHIMKSIVTHRSGGAAHFILIIFVRIDNFLCHSTRHSTEYKSTLSNVKHAYIYFVYLRWVFFLYCNTQTCRCSLEIASKMYQTCAWRWKNNMTTTKVQNAVKIPFCGSICRRMNKFSFVSTYANVTICPDIGTIYFLVTSIGLSLLHRIFLHSMIYQRSISISPCIARTKNAI